MEEFRYIVTKRWGVLKLTRGADTFWRSDDGTIFSYVEGVSRDPIDRCGIGFFSLPTDNSLTAICTVHDYLYSAPVWQAFHTREEADQCLREMILKEPSLWRLLAYPFYFISRLFGGRYWENKETR